MNLFVSLLISISLVFNSFYYGLGVGDIMLSVISSFLTFVYFGRINWRNKLSSLSVLLYCYLSMSFLPFSHLVPPIWNDIDLFRIALFGGRVYFVVILSMVVCSVFQKRYNNNRLNIKGSYIITDKNVKHFFAITWFASIISYALGVSVMGAEATELPFHMSGVLHDYRTVFAPLFFMIIVENRVLNHKKVPRKWYAIFVVWCLFESFLRISKSSLVWGMMPVGLFLILYYKPSFKKLSLYMVPFVLAALFIYVVIGGMRGSGKATLSGFTEARNNATTGVISDEWGGPVTASFNRMFMSAMNYRADYYEFDQGRLFDFSKVPLIVLWKGTARYRTYQLHSKTEDMFDSDGTTGIIDPLFWGGYGFCYIILFITAGFAVVVEERTKGRLGLQISYALIFYNLIMTGNISWILSQNMFSYYVVRLIAIYVLIRLNYKYKKKMSNNIITAQ